MPQWNTGVGGLCVFLAPWLLMHPGALLYTQERAKLGAPGARRGFESAQVGICNRARYILEYTTVQIATAMLDSARAGTRARADTMVLRPLVQQ
eukprot:COSAG02_NODE_14263_length_1291_cov_2.932886_1_plen_94_part_00